MAVMTPPSIIRFASFEVDLRSGELRKHGLRVKLQPKSFEILRLLIERPGEVVARSELQQGLWPDDTFVEFDNNMNHSISRLREALGDSAESPRFIETLPRRGYRFVAPIDSPAAPATAGASTPAARTASRKWWAAGLVVALTAVLAVTVYRVMTPPRPPLNSLVVLPLVTMDASEGSGDEYLAFGMTEALTSALSKIRALKVISQTSAMQYKKAGKSLPQIAKELGVEAVVEGSVVREGNQVRITVQLIEAASDTHLWAETYQRELHNILALQTEIARTIAREIHVTLTPGEQAALSAAPPVNPAAHEAYLRGRYFWKKRTLEGIEKSLPYLQQAVAIDPSYARAYAGLADTYWDLAAGFEPDPQQRLKARKNGWAAAHKALELDDTLADAHTTLGFFLLHFDWDWAGAEKAFCRALALNPNDAEAHGGLAEYFWAMNQPEEALRQCRRAYELNPTALLSNRGLGSAFFFAGQFDKAVEYYQRAAEMEQDPLSRLNLAMVRSHQGRHREAIVQVQQAAKLLQADFVEAVMAYALALAGERAEAQKIARRLEIKTDGQPLFIAMIYTALGNRDKAFALLNRSYLERESELFGIRVMPQFALLRDDPRFRDLLRRMNLPN